MICYLSGTLHKDLYGVPNIGMMLSPRSTKSVPPGMPCALDNCCFGGNFPGNDALLRFLDSRPRADVLFAVAPDWVGRAGLTWLRSKPMLPRIRALGFPVALAAQNGFSATLVDWDAFDWLFIGGDDTFKLGAEGRAATGEALRRGKRVHMGRVNSWQRLAYAAGLGCESADGTTIRFNPGRYVGEVSRWLARVNAPRLVEV